MGGFKIDTKEGRTERERKEVRSGVSTGDLSLKRACAVGHGLLAADD